MSKTVRPRRSVLYMPGANTRALEKARSLPADALIFDLEDAVAPDANEAARTNVVAAAGTTPSDRREPPRPATGPGTGGVRPAFGPFPPPGADAFLAPKAESP